jgi:hypothetical protein
LRGFRRKNKVATFWIDQICITQEDIAERNGQVPQIEEIYGGVQTVCIWLGTEGEDSNLAISFLISIHVTLRARNELDIMNYGTLLAKEFPLQTVKEWKAVAALLRRAWFGRMWIVQEVATAAIAKIVCGPAETLGTEFVDVTRWMAHEKTYFSLTSSL